MTDNRYDHINFYEKCFKVVKTIPLGKVTTYGLIAKSLGTYKSARLVGWAMNNSHGKGLPSHRVVNRNGLLTGKHNFGGVNVMKELLINEGHKFKGDKILNLDKVLWIPK
ncbi:MAG: MGMT family protein [Flavobacteriales bacterium TMED288]|mgnify:CR=1 FL=1|nr:cysteine methyltransferase [Flavobacteriales bacterium]RPG53831.1 MAG: MGMT family protein [Flavobacteriales bacterium TMED288]|tara:strand:+ start:285 stop:614 length:330 start_codon:yes stop_codon:yes gene_type:complete